MSDFGFRLLTANLANGAADPGAFADLVEAAEPDVVLVQELAPEQAEALAIERSRRVSVSQALIRVVPSVAIERVHVRQRPGHRRSRPPGDGTPGPEATGTLDLR